MCRKFSLDLLGYHLIADGQRIPLTDTEMRVAHYLHDNRGRVVPPHEMMVNLWNDPNPVDTTIVRMTISSIRKKAGDDVIVTRHRLGYSWGEAGEDS